MSLVREEAVERMRRDHDAMVELIRRIQSLCTQTDKVESCHQCQPNQRDVCHATIDQLVRAFVEATLKHNLIESLYMEEGVPHAHRLAHNQAHMDIANQMKAIRVVLSEDGNCVLAIAGIDRVFATLLAHFADYDQQLETYLLAPVPV